MTPGRRHPSLGIRWVEYLYLTVEAGPSAGNDADRACGEAHGRESGHLRRRLAAWVAAALACSTSVRFMSRRKRS
jgi:hypothetical protein